MFPDPTGFGSTTLTQILLRAWLRAPGNPYMQAFTWTRGRILGRNWDKNLKSCPPCYLQSPLLRIFFPLLRKIGLKLVCNVNIVHGNLKSENSQDYAQKPQRNCTFMSSASGVKVFCLRPVERYDVVPSLIQSQNNALFLQFFSKKRQGECILGKGKWRTKKVISVTILAGLFCTLPFSCSPI
jgi:hypothetical protein